MTDGCRRNEARARGKHALFVLFILLSCAERQEHTEPQVELIWQKDRATGLSIQSQEVSDLPTDSLASWVEVRLSQPKHTLAILGEFKRSTDGIVFEPVVPFTRGLSYEVRVSQKRIAEFDVPRASDSPEVISVYPSADTLPENLLKVYLQFSRPMREGQSLRQVALLSAAGDTLRQVFLDLQPELWNADGTRLTLWLDPGRIKRDLHPNRLLGAPLQKGQAYTLTISSKWEDKQGASLLRSYSRRFVAAARDSLSPDPQKWKLSSPQSGTRNPLVVEFSEGLDYVLLIESIRVADENNNSLKGTVTISNKERRYTFHPIAPWKAMTYHLEIEPRLEDQAGNNLVRPFDRDLRNSTVTNDRDKIFLKKFRVE